ncbi:MAG: hypothetical protein FWH19_04410 [Treponema sp.]|nr:hypothetical protein [Treponema sp.]
MFILIFHVFGESITEEDEIIFFEEFFIFGDFFFLDESPMDEESLFEDEILLAEESFLDEDEFLEDLFDTFFLDAPPLVIEAPVFETRSLDAIFPDLSWWQRAMMNSNEGLRHSFSINQSPMLYTSPDSGIDLIGSIMDIEPSHLIEALVLIPYNERELDLLDIYNALGRIGQIENYPVLINGNNFYVITESTRIESSSNRRAISDPLPAERLPFSETIYIRLREVTIGNLFLRGDISISLYGITYSMTNFTDIRYFFLPVMRAEKFKTLIYLEPVSEGLLIYTMSGFYLPDFISDRVNLTPNINRRIQIFKNWITDGLRMQESLAAAE